MAQVLFFPADAPFLLFSRGGLAFIHLNKTDVTLLSPPGAAATQLSEEKPIPRKISQITPGRNEKYVLFQFIIEPGRRAN